MVAMASEPSPNLQLWTRCCCSLNPDPICFFNFRLLHLTLTILGLPWLKMFNPFFPLAQTVGVASETPTVCTLLHRGAALHRWNQSHLVQDHQWGGTLLSTPYWLHECWNSLCCPAASEPSAQPVTLRERPWKSTLVTPELWAWSNLPHLHTGPDSFKQSQKHCSRMSVISDNHLWWNPDFSI